MKINSPYPVTRRRKIAVSLAVALFVMMTLAGAPFSSRGQAVSPGPTSQPAAKLIIDDSVAGDFRRLAEETWGKFLTVFAAHRACFGDVRLRATRTLNSRAAYNPNTATVTVRVPATAAILQEALIHEWAHHLEYQCEAHQELRAAFLAAQGLPPETPWRPNRDPADVPVSAWAGIPSEQYAEAAIEAVLGRRQVSTGVRVSGAAVHVIEMWAVSK